MADTLKFGPEWLRALSDGGSGGPTCSTPPQSPAQPVYKLAEHRYGREEMLALMAGPLDPPPSLVDHSQIYVETSMAPMAYRTMSDDEQRMMSQSVNSSLVLRLMGRSGPDRGMERGPGAPFMERGPGAPFPSSQGPARGMPNRGPIADRGRGRGRGRGDGGYFGRPSSTSEEGGGEPGMRGNRGFQRSESMEERDKRFAERGFPPRGPGDEDNMGPAQRREFSRSMSNDNWRSADRDREPLRDVPKGAPLRELPSKGAPPAGKGAPFTNGDPRAEEDEDGGGWRRAGSDKWGGRGSWRDRSARAPEEHDFRNSYRSHRSHDDDYTGEDGLPEWSTVDVNDMVGTFDSSGAFLAESGKFSPRDGPVRSPRDRQQTNGTDSYRRTSDKTNNERMDPPRSNSEKDLASHHDPSPEPVRPHPSARATKSLEKMPSPQKPTLHSPTLESQPPAPHHAHSEQYIQGQRHERQTPELERRASEELHPAESLAQSILQTADDEEDREASRAESAEHRTSPSSGYHPDDQWFYKDPQGEIQGPFGNGNMTEWFTAGYFTMNLLVKRQQDQLFTTLGDLIKQFGGVPFIRAGSPTAAAQAAQGKTREPTKAQSQSSALPPDVPASVSSAAGPLGAPVGPQPRGAPGPADGAMDPLAQQRLLYLWWGQQMAKNEKFARLPAAQQHQVLLQLMSQPPAHMLQTQQTAPLPSDPALAAMMLRAQQPGLMTSQSSPMTSQAPGASPAWRQPTTQTPQFGQSVWDVPPSRPKEQEDSSRLSQQAQEARMEEMRRKEDEERRKRVEEEEERLRQLERQRQEEEERLRAMERQRELEEEKERERQLELEQKRELERRREQEERDRKMREEEDRKKREEEVERKREEETRRRDEMKRKRLEEQRRQEEVLRQQAVEEEGKRQMEIQRRTMEHELMRYEMQRQQEIKRHQQEAMKRLQDEQEKFSQQPPLPVTARWGASQPSNKDNNNSQLSLAQIQQLQEEKERAEREEASRQRARQAQQQAQLQAQQDQFKPTWNSPTSVRSRNSTTTSAKSLMEIQEEQARQLESDQKQKKKIHKEAVPLATAVVWGGNHARWAQDGAWGAPTQTHAPQAQNKPKQALGFWDEALQASSKARTPANTNAANFPGLYVNNNKPAPASQKSKSKQPKDEDNVARLFQQTSQPRDDFTRWCSDALSGMHTSVDVPTFISFLLEVESPYEVHDYVRSYLGESKDANQFAKDFIERRSRLKNSGRQSPREDLSGPAPAVCPREHHPAPHSVHRAGGPPALPTDHAPSRGGHAHLAEQEEEFQSASRKQKKKMQKLEASSILGFTVGASQNRVNIGEIEKPN